MKLTVVLVMGNMLGMPIVPKLVSNCVVGNSLLKKNRPVVSIISQPVLYYDVEFK